MSQIISGYAKALFNLARHCADPSLAAQAVQYGAVVEITHRASAGSVVCAGLCEAAKKQADQVLEQIVALQ